MAALEQALAKIESQKFDVEKELEMRDNELRDRGQTIEELEIDVKFEIQSTSDALELAEDRLQDIKRLVHWLHVVEFHLGSWRWRGGRSTVGTLAKMIGRTKGGIDADDINKLLATFKRWEHTKDDTGAGELAVLTNESPGQKNPDRHVVLLQTSGLFDTNWYLKEYPDVKENGMNPIEHYIKFGSKENRNPSPDFDTKWYLQNYPDVAKKGINPLEHYILHGRGEFRSPKPFLRLVAPDDSNEKD